VEMTLLLSAAGATSHSPARQCRVCAVKQIASPAGTTFNTGNSLLACVELQ
jgi:hypothetical protein